MDPKTSKHKAVDCDCKYPCWAGEGIFTAIAGESTPIDARLWNDWFSTPEGTHFVNTTLMEKMREQVARFYNRCVSEDEDDWQDYVEWITETADPIEAFDGSNWSEAKGKIVDEGKDTRFLNTSMFYFSDIQLHKGMPRHDIAVLDAGKKRMVIMPPR